MWFSAAGMCTGVLWGATRPSRALGVVLVVLGTLILFGRRHGAVAMTAGIVLTSLGGGVVAASLRAAPQPIEGIASEVPRCAIEGRILEGANGLGTLIVVDTLSCAERTATVPGTIVIDGAIGDAGARVTGEGWLIPLGDEGFDEARTRAGAGAAFDPDAIDVAAPPTGLHAVAADVREGLRDATADLDPRAAGLARGLSIGDTSGLEAVTLERFRRAGLSHLLAVSGSNVAIVLGCIALICLRLRLAVRIAACGIALVLFVLVVGPDASVLRAGAMGGIALVAVAWGRDSEPLHLLGLAVLGVVAVRPGIVFSVGLHLSVAATLGIVLWARRIESAVMFLPGVLRLPLSVTLAAQLAVVPIIVGTFGELSLAAPVANLVAAPAVAPATILTLAGGTVATVLEPVGEWIATGAEPFALWILMTGDVFGSAGWASIEVSKLWAGPLLLGVFATHITLKKRHPERLTSGHGGMDLDTARRRGQGPAVDRRVLVEGGRGGMDG